MSDDQPPAYTADATSTSAWQIDTHNHLTTSAIQTSLAALQEGSALAAKIPGIAPVAGLLLQVLKMRDEVKQYKEECKSLMCNLTRVASIIVNASKMCGRHNLSKEELPASLLAILGSLQKEQYGIECVVKKCSNKKGIKGVLLRNDLSAKIKQCDGDLSNVLQAFQAELALETRFAWIAERREMEKRRLTVNGGSVKATSDVPRGSNGSFGIKGALDALWSGISTWYHGDTRAEAARDPEPAGQPSMLLGGPLTASHAVPEAEKRGGIPGTRDGHAGMGSLPSATLLLLHTDATRGQGWNGISEAAGQPPILLDAPPPHTNAVHRPSSGGATQAPSLPTGTRGNGKPSPFLCLPPLLAHGCDTRAGAERELRSSGAAPHAAGQGPLTPRPRSFPAAVGPLPFPLDNAGAGAGTRRRLHKPISGSTPGLHERANRGQCTYLGVGVGGIHGVRQPMSLQQTRFQSRI